MPSLWLGDLEEKDAPRQRFHIEIYVAPEVVEERIAAALAAGGATIDDSNAPGRQQGSHLRRHVHCEERLNR